MSTNAETSDRIEAERIFSRVFSSITGTSVDIHTFREAVTLGEAHVTDKLATRNGRWAERFLSDPDNDKFFLDKTGFIEMTGGAVALARALTSKQLETVTRSVAAASIVFMHSALDGAIYDLCRICALLAPADWEPFLAEQRVALSSVKSNDYNTLLRQLLDKHLLTLERQSLLAKIDRLFQLCRPEAGVTPVKGYAYDRARIAVIDEERHRIVHGDSHVPDGVPEKVDLLRDTGLHMLGLVNHRYGVRINPEFVWRP